MSADQIRSLFVFACFGWFGVDCGKLIMNSGGQNNILTEKAEHLVLYRTLLNNLGQRCGSERFGISSGLLQNRLQNNAGLRQKKEDG